ncbi:WXG100 family type VII secretion target [Lapillicoccus sp.]|uniref:WXG100 family type VII secretion target n=1 Tax=Lapillicoccus sp. TaxID=1909287 RepID=UPI003264B626
MSFSYMVDLDKLDESIGDMSKFDGQVDKHLANLDTVVAKLHGTWHGDAADKQREAHTKWTEGATGMRTALGEMQAAATTAHTNYTNAINANRKTWAQVR